MQILIISRLETPRKVADWLKGELPKYLNVLDVGVMEAWVSIPSGIEGSAPQVTCEELRGVVSFSIGDGEFDLAVQVLTSIFEGTGMEFYAPDLNFNWMVG